MPAINFEFLLKGMGEAGGKEKRREKEKTIFLNSVVCLVGLGTRRDLGPRLLIRRESMGGWGLGGQSMVGVQNSSTQTPRPLSASVRFTETT